MKPRPSPRIADDQIQLDFGQPSSGVDGLSVWRKGLASRQSEVGHRLGVPVGRKVAVRLVCGLELRGRLEFDEDSLFPRTDRKAVMLRIDKANFRLIEIAACVTLDD
jgi:hypothetical protein